MRGPELSWRRQLALGTALWLLLASAPAQDVDGTDRRLIEAVKQADVAAVGRLIDSVLIDLAEADGMTALHWSALADDAAIAALLIDAGADVDAMTRYGVTPLAIAALNGNASLTATLLAAGANPNAATPGGETVLLTAARTGDGATIERLLDAGASVNATETWRSETALMWAAGENNAEAVRVLAARGAELDLSSRMLEWPDIRFNLAFMATTELPRGGFSAVMYAAREGAIDAARELAALGANLDIQDPVGTTALMLATINSHYALAAMLVEMGADPNVYDDAGMGALYAAVDMHTAQPLTNLPPRQAAGTFDALDLVAVLLEHGADPDATLSMPTLRRHHSGGDGSLGDGTTPLMRAARFGDTAAIRLLLEHDADPAIAQENGTTAFLIAAGSGFRTGDGGFGRMDPGTEADAIEGLGLLLAHGADLDGANANGETAVHFAAARGGEQIVRFLAERGATLSAVDRFGRTPLDVALGAPAVEPDREASRGPVREGTAALLRELMATEPTGE